MSSSTACDSGTSAAPNDALQQAEQHHLGQARPAMPHSTEATVKPTIETRNSRLRPKRSASQPVSGVMIAAATM